MNKVKLADFDRTQLEKGAGKLKIFLWFFINAFIFKSSYIPFFKLKTALLRLFGAKIGKNVLIMPSVNIRYPWKLKIGNNSWIGEEAWIMNLADVTISNNVCVSQGAMLLTGNHDYSDPAFPQVNKPVILEEGVWIGAKSVVCPGVKCKSHSILSAGSTTSKDLEAFSIYRGNPAVYIKKREIKSN